MRSTSPFLRGFLLCVFVVIGCGKDASIQLTRPEGQKTRRVHFSLETIDAGNIHAEINYPDNQVTMNSSGQRAIDLPIGQNVEFKAQLPDGWEVKDWNVNPGGNVDFFKGDSSIKINNVQEDTKVTMLVQKIPPERIDTKQVRFVIESAKSAPITAEISAASDAVKFEGSAQRLYSVPTGKPFEVTLNLPEIWEVESWKIDGDVNHDDNATSSKLHLEAITDNCTVTVKVRPVPKLEFQVRAKGTWHLGIRPGSGYVKWKVYPPGAKAVAPWGAWDGYVSTADGNDQPFPEASEVKSYDNGSQIYLEFMAIDKDGDFHKYNDTILLDRPKRLDFDFTKVKDILIEKKNIYELLGINPKTAKWENN